MNKKIFNLKEDDAMRVISLFKGVCTDEGILPLNDIHRATLVAIGSHIFGTTVEIEGLDPTFSASAHWFTDPDLQHEISHMAAVFPFLDSDGVRQRSAALARLAKMWGATDLNIRSAVSFARGHKALILLDAFRINHSELGNGLVGQSWGLVKGVLKLDGNKDVLARYESYRELDSHTLGHTLATYYDDNHFPLPGSVGAAFSNTLTTHDRHHVLSGYDTTPLGEVCVLAFDSAISRSNFGGAFIGAVAQFQVGYIFDPSVRAWQHQFNPAIVYRAIERGHACKVNYLDEYVDLDSLMEYPIDEVREHFGIPAEGAMVRGPDDPWCGEMGPVDQRQSPDIVDEGLIKFN
jgi:hypothetical protein